MPSPTKGVPVQLDRERRLRFPLGVLEGFDNITLKDLPRVLHAGLKHEFTAEDSLTVEQIAEMVDLEMMPSLAEPLKKATGGLINIIFMFSQNGSGPEDDEGKATAPAADG